MNDTGDNPAGPSHREGDRNLLFGIMALRVGLISASQLVDALHIWVDERKKPLPGILIDQGFASKENVSLLEPIVDTYIRQHGGRIEDSLARFSPAKNSQVNEDKNPANIPTLNELGEASGDNYGTLPPASLKDRFQVIAYHDEGGLGRVSVALDTEVGRNVAFKEIKDEYADDPEYRDRFLREAEITGRLEHPGIVPVYGLGRLVSGRPYYAMRFIEGESLKVAIEELHKNSSNPFVTKRVVFRKLLERFLDVCNAIQYAHSCGVIHRDLKPSNIMLGRHGETLVVDWGLAKTIGAANEKQSLADGNEITWIRPRFGSSAVSFHGAAVGSPAFMSPEQAQGDLDMLGPPTDVFGLGATLYFLLTGQSPYGNGDTREIIRKARDGVFLAPRELNSEIPETLAVVCETAMSAKIEDRYQNATELREAIWQWLADEPLSAMLATVKHFDSLHQQDPRVLQFRLRLANELNSLSKIYQSLHRLTEAIQASERAVSLMEQLLLNDHWEISEFQELHASRTQLAAVLRMSGETEKADQLNASNLEQFNQFLRLVSRDSKQHEQLLNLSLHQGFSKKEADALLQRYLDDLKIEDDKGLDSQTATSGGSPNYEAVSPDITGHLTITPPSTWSGSEAKFASVEDRYQLLDVLGEGGGGVVYRALDKLLPREVAIKISRREDSFNKSMLLKEGAITSLLEQPNIIPTYGAGFLGEDREPYLVLRMIYGTDWGKQVAASGALFSGQISDPKKLLRAFADICEAVDYAHNLGIVHGDPKLQNILLENTGHAWLIDWGLAHIFDEQKFEQIRSYRKIPMPEGLKAAMSHFREQKGAIIGTPRYMAPETALGDGISPKSDIFVLGASLFYLVTGDSHVTQRTLFRNALEILEEVKRGEFRNARAVNRAVPKKLSKLLEKALTPDPQHRLSSAAELAKAIRSQAK